MPRPRRKNPTPSILWVTQKDGYYKIADIQEFNHYELKTLELIPLEDLESEHGVSPKTITEIANNVGIQYRAIEQVEVLKDEAKPPVQLLCEVKTLETNAGFITLENNSLPGIVPCADLGPYQSYVIRKDTGTTLLVIHVLLLQYEEDEEVEITLKLTRKRIYELVSSDGDSYAIPEEFLEILEENM
jgi:hypothetical protein